MNVFVKLTNGKLPTNKEGDAGWDLYSTEQVAVRPGETVKISTGISLEIPPGFYGQIADRSGLGSRGLKVMGGVIDSTYRGEVKVMLCNTKQGDDYDTFVIQNGERVAQIIFLPCPTVNMVEVKELSETQRGEDGFGSTGRF